MVKRRHPEFFEVLDADERALIEARHPSFLSKLLAPVAEAVVPAPTDMDMAANPAMLPSGEQFKRLATAAGVGFIGFGGAVATGRALAGVPSVQNVLAFWAIASLLDNPALNILKPYVVAGAGIAALVNVALNLVAQRTISAQKAAWFLPGAGAAAAAPAQITEPNAIAGLGQADVYEAALDGVGGIEEDLERELSMGDAGDGIFDESVFGEYLETPLGAEVEEAAAGTGEYLEVPLSAEVEEAAAGTGEYLETPLGAEVEEAFAGIGEYLETPLGAEVEEAFAGGMGQYQHVPGLGQVNSGNKLNQLLPGARQAIQRIVRKRLATGLPLNQAFYTKLGQAAAKLSAARGLRGGKPGVLPMAPAKSPVLRSSAPTYVKQVLDPKDTPGSAEPISSGVEKEFSGIFEGNNSDGIF
jgi:hypothetical protein